MLKQETTVFKDAVLTKWDNKKIFINVDKILSKKEDKRVFGLYFRRVIIRDPKIEYKSTSSIAYNTRPHSKYVIATTRIGLSEEAVEILTHTLPLALKNLKL